MVFKTISIALFFFLSLSMCRCDEFAEATPSGGFTVDLIHRDSPHSPYYDPSSSPWLRLADSFNRSFNRFQNSFLNQQQRPPQPKIINSGGEYFMEFSVGTPPRPSLGTLDTGSDLTWTQCLPCTKCFNQTLPIFAPKSSSTYRDVPCDSPRCSYFQATSCSRKAGTCRYNETYGDGSSSAGAVAMETLTLGQISVPRFVFGCGTRNSDQFPGGRSGTVGLGGGKGSLIRQLGAVAQGKFSYCLVSLSDINSNSGKLNFGAKAVVSGRGAAATPLARKIPDTFYYLAMEGISVGNRRLEFYNRRLADSRVQVEGNIIIDSGTTLTLLPQRLYAEVEAAMRSSIKRKAVGDPSGALSLCYLSKGNLGIPNVTVHFKGADVRLSEENVFVRTSEDTVCLAAAPARGEAIYGNLAQVNFLVGYDLVTRTVSFKRADCGKQ